jgi:alpha-1,2-mannosyltransferase
MIPMALVLHYLLLLSSSLVCLLLVPLAWLLRPRQPPTNPKVFGFFHPYCSGGGGGERVLWKIIQNLQRHGKECVIYAVDPPTTNEAQLRKDAARRFDVKIDQQVTLVSLETYKHFLLPSPFLSLILESWGTMKLAYQALKIHSPDVFCDTTGCAFTFAVARWMHPACWIVAYVHYPTISTDMMQWEWQQTNRSRPRTILKIVYYWGFALLYGLVGSLADLVMVNSTWTYNHIARLWRFSNHQIEIVYPPCRVIEEKIATKREPTIVSIGQFRPEKNHKLQIEAVATLLKQYPEHSDRLKLLLIGSCRNTEDEQRVEELRELIKALKVEDVVEFSINPPNSDLLDSMKKACKCFKWSPMFNVLLASVLIGTFYLSCVSHWDSHDATRAFRDRSSRNDGGWSIGDST